MLLTKVVCTLGPATSDADVIRRLVEGGLDVARVNMSHGNHEHHAQVIARVRDAAKEAQRPVGILVDLQGPKIRVGALAAPVLLTPGETVTFAPEGDQRGSELPTTYKLLAKRSPRVTRCCWTTGCSSWSARVRMAIAPTTRWCAAACSRATRV